MRWRACGIQTLERRGRRVRRRRFRSRRLNSKAGEQQRAPNLKAFRRWDRQKPNQRTRLHRRRMFEQFIHRACEADDPPLPLCPDMFEGGSGALEQNNYIIWSEGLEGDQVSAESNLDPAVHLENESSTGNINGEDNDTIWGKGPEGDQASAESNLDLEIHLWDENSTHNTGGGEKSLPNEFYISLPIDTRDEDFVLEPAMLLRISSHCPADIEHGLWSVNDFFRYHVREKDQTKFLPVILPETRCSDDKVETACKDIEVVYQFCLPHDRMMSKEYLKNTANEIKAKVKEFKDSRDEMGEFGYSDDEMEEDDGYDYKEMEPVLLCSFDDESMEYTCEDKRPEASHISGTPEREMIELQLSPADGFTTITDEEKRPEASHISGTPDKEMSELQLSPADSFTMITDEEKRPKASHISGTLDREMGGLQLSPADGFSTITDATLQHSHNAFYFCYAKGANIKTWACVNFSTIRSKKLLRFLSKLGNMCMSIGMNLSLEPTMLIHVNSSRRTDFSNILWAVFNSFSHLKMEKRDTLLLVILPEALYSYEDVEIVCENLGFVYQFCPPWKARRASKKYLKIAAKKIKATVLECYGLSDSCEGMSKDNPEEFCCSEETGEDDSEQSDSDAEMGVNLYSSYIELRKDGISHKLAGLDEN